MNAVCKSSSYQATCSSHLYSLLPSPEEGCHTSAIDFCRHFPLISTKWLLITRTGENSSMWAALFITETKSFAMRRKAGEEEQDYQGWRMPMPRQIPGFWKGRWNQFFAMAGFPEKLSVNSIFNLRLNLAFMISGEKQRQRSCWIKYLLPFLD